MQYLVTINKDRVPPDAQIFVVGNPPSGWLPKPGDFQWNRDRIGIPKYLIDEMPRIEPGKESINLLQYLEREHSKQCIVTAQVKLDTCVAVAWLQLTRKQQQANQEILRALSMECNYLDECSKLSPLSDFTAGVIVAMQQEESKLESRIGEFWAGAAFWHGGSVYLKREDIEGIITHIHVNDRCVEVDCGSEGIHRSEYWNTTYPKVRSRWSEEQRESYESLMFRVRVEWLIAACRGDRQWSGAQHWEQIHAGKG